MMGSMKPLAAALALLFPAMALAVTINSNTTAPSGRVLGSLSKGGGSFLIDHPLDPKNKLLYHSFVESPDVKNIYDGIVTLDDNGEAAVELPDYFLALNEGFRYLATPLGEPAPGLYVKKEIGRKYLFGTVGPIVFRLAGGPPHAKISWQVTGIRHDPYILANPIVPEVEKTADTLVPRGEYLFPEYEKYD